MLIRIFIVIVFCLTASLKNEVSSDYDNIALGIIHNNNTDTRYQPDLKNKIKTINIGLLISEPESKNSIAQAAKQGAQLAIDQANASMGKKTRILYKLIVRSCEGAWGAGSKAAVDLVFDDSVRVILTSLDGRNGHLAEQVIAKTKVAMLSTRETDLSLTQAYIPWYYRCIPNDMQQAEALVKEFIKRKIKKIIAVSDDGYDGKQSCNQFIKTMISAGAVKPVQIIYNYRQPDFNKVLEQIQATGIKNIVLFGQPETSLQLIKLIKEKKIEVSIFGSISVLGEYKTLTESMKYFENTIIVSSGHWFTEKGKKFHEEFMSAYGNQPGNSAAYAYDGMNVILETIKNAGSDCEKIIESIPAIKYEGVTGFIQFDDKGNRKGELNFIEIKNGIPTSVK